MSVEERKKIHLKPNVPKDKLDGTIKAKGYAEGRSQREYTTKSEISSLTESLEAIMFSCAIDAGT